MARIMPDRFRVCDYPVTHLGAAARRSLGEMHRLLDRNLDEGALGFDGDRLAVQKAAGRLPIAGSVI
jgi:N-acyl-D-aspartate/D-glutamate deacylase